jgi:uncharacterized protein (UPF0332 family)
LNEDAGRTAYLAGLHAAQALIYESTGKVIKRHSGVQREFARLVKDDPRFDMELRAFLPRTYHLKAIAENRSRLPSVSRTRPRGHSDGAAFCGERR